MTDEMTPKWAVELLIGFEKLDAKITAAEERNNAHSEWAVRNTLDHEKRIRTLEQFRWMILGVVAISGLLGGLVTKLLAL